MDKLKLFSSPRSITEKQRQFCEPQRGRFEAHKGLAGGFFPHWTRGEVQDDQIYRGGGEKKCQAGEAGMPTLEQHLMPGQAHQRRGWMRSHRLIAFTWTLPSLNKNLTRQPQASLVALHHMPITENIRLNTFAQNITKRTVGTRLNNASAASALRFARLHARKPPEVKAVVNKGRTQLTTSTSQGSYCFPFPSCYSPPLSFWRPTAVGFILFALRFCFLAAGLFL